VGAAQPARRGRRDGAVTGARDVRDRAGRDDRVRRDHPRDLVLYAAATSFAGRWTGIRGAPALFAHSVVPIAAGYAIAHYFSLLFFEGQLTWILLSNPFGQDGVDLFGTYRNSVDLTVLSPHTIAVVQVGAIVLGHVLGVVLAHDRAVRLSGRDRDARRAQYPLLLLMVGLTVGGLGLLLG
jgi:hypothetical protein